MTRNLLNSDSIEIIGADANNLKNINVSFPLKQISVVTGVSGSGKSSLLVDTLAGEAARRTRTFLGIAQEEVEQDDVRAFIGHVPPSILVGQRGFRPSIRTTVGTATGLLSILRRLFTLAAVPYSNQADSDVPPPSPKSYTEWIVRHYRGQAEIWAAPVRWERTDGIRAAKLLLLHGIKQIVVFSETDPPRLRETGRVMEAENFKGLSANVSHMIEASVGAVNIKGPESGKELSGFLSQAFAASPGSVVVTLPAADNPYLTGPFGPRLDSLQHWVHPKDAAIFAPPSSHLLSFNAPEHELSGACPECRGTGIGRELREDVLIAHPNRSMRDGAFAIWTDKNYKYVNIQHETIEGLRGLQGFSPEIAWRKLPASARSLVLNGSGNELVFDRDRSGRKFGTARPFLGFRKIILDKSAGGTKVAEQLAAYVKSGVCEGCSGTRWSFQARALRVGGFGIAGILQMTFTDLLDFADGKKKFASSVPAKVKPLVLAIEQQARSLKDVGLGYLSADRGMLDVSEGESRRTRLARVLKARESGLCLLLDEPARGLHESDLSSLGQSMERLRGQHTIILNEHREALWNVADWFIEIGPGAGRAGGEMVTAQERPKVEPWNDKQLRQGIPVSKQAMVTIRGATIHNLKNLDCEIPLGRLTCITGVSGSGKSSFIRGVLAPALFRELNKVPEDFVLRQGEWRSIGGIGAISDVVALDQVMPPANRRSLVATLTGVFDSIRKTFAMSEEAKREGLTHSDFGVNAGNGRCTICAGIGEIIDDDLWSVCPACGGSRYGQAVLAIRNFDVNIQELLEKPIDSLDSVAKHFGVPGNLISAMTELGVGYLSLGRRIDTLSGGELQRLRLAMRLANSSNGSLFFILDEPAVGLHPRDVERIITALDRALEGGRNTVVIVEHDLRLIRAADWILDFGPGSGPEGGKIVFSGTPHELARAKTKTGLALAGKLPREEAPPKPAGRPEVSNLSPAEQIKRTMELMRNLITGDAPAIDSNEGTAEPAVPIVEDFWAGRANWELVGLDFEIPKLLIDIQVPHEQDIFASGVDVWKKEPDGWLAIHPFLTDMQIWGSELPQSILRAVSSHLSQEGLQLVDLKGHSIRGNINIRQVRATGSRLVPKDNQESSLRQALQDAFAIGAHFVELRDRNGRLKITISDRLVDLAEALVAPMIPVPSYFSRLHDRGRCPMCKGSRGVTILSEALVIGNKNVPPDNEHFLTPQANAIMKGVRHNEMLPFLRRLERENLWDSKVSFKDLDQSKENMILFGFWARPGPGSFLKSPSVPASEVASWLRWDGLFRHILSQLERSSDVNWKRRLDESATTVRCRMCGGTGLQPFASLLRIGSMSFPEWTLLSDSIEQFNLLQQLDCRTERQKHTLKRILRCLEPPRKSAKASLPALVLQRVVESFTTMAAVYLTEAD